MTPCPPDELQNLIHGRMHYAEITEFYHGYLVLAQDPTYNQVAIPQLQSARWTAGTTIYCGSGRFAAARLMNLR